jgi:RNA polymerase sigma factor (sigma-70 family)
MAKEYVWSARVAAAVAALPPHDGRLPTEYARFWPMVESRGSAALPPEVLAYLLRIAHAQGDRAAAERLFTELWDRYAPYVASYARRYQQRLQRMVTIDDVTVDVFVSLNSRLSSASGITFFEACFLPGLKRLTLDKVQRLPDEPTTSLTMTPDEGDGDAQWDMPDPDAEDPQERSEERERRQALREALPPMLQSLPERVQQTARMLMDGMSEGEIARQIGVTPRMVTNYKAAIRSALAEFG